MEKTVRSFSGTFLEEKHWFKSFPPFFLSGPHDNWVVNRDIMYVKHYVSLYTKSESETLVNRFVFILLTQSFTSC